jgi:FkbM family methyltransferase
MQSSLNAEVMETTESKPAACTNNQVTEKVAHASAEGCPALEARVLECLQRADFTQALALLDAALMVRETAVLWNDWGSVQFRAGDPAKAENGYRRALAMDPELRDAAVNLGFLLLKTGRHDQADSILSKYLASLNQQEQQVLASARPAKQQAVTDDAQAKIERLEKAVEYLLLKQVNAQPSGSIGRGSYDALVESFWKLLQTVEPKYFFDIGANDASTARRIKQLLPSCEVWAFEANPKIHAKFLPAVAASGVRYVNLAVAATCGQITLYMPRTYTKALINGDIHHRPSVEPQDTGRSSVLKRNEEATYEEFTVPSVTLDQLFEVRGMVDDNRDAVLWVDVEGAAYEVLAAAKAALRKAAILFVEAENHPFWTGQKQCADVARILFEAGFIPLERDREYGDKQFNTIFVHQSLLHLVYPKTFLTKDPIQPATPPRQVVPPAPGKRFKAYRSIAAHLTASIPVIIPVFNNPSYTENMVRQLVDRGLENICLVDNGSTSSAMLAFLERAENYATVIRTGHNHGPRHTLLNAAHYNLLPELFCVTDPDLELNPEMPEDFISELARVTEHFKIGKAGLALRIDDADQMHGEKFFIAGREYHVPEWEQQWWKDEVGRISDGNRIYRAVTDTTFALYNKKYFSPHLFFHSVRVAGTYTCRHLPWYRDNGLNATEEQFYRSTQKWSYHLSEAGKVSQAERGL